MLSACATRPAIEDVTGANAFDIAQAIRCEMRDGLKSILADATDAGGEGEQGLAGEAKKARYDRLALEMRRRGYRAPKVEAEFFYDFFDNMKKAAAAAGKKERNTDEEELQAAVALYAPAAIGYEFDLELKNTNDIEGGIDVLSTLTRETVSLSPNAALKRSRKATRTFRLLDSFQGLLTNENMIGICNSLRGNPPKASTRSTIYPIQGSLGLEDLFREFLSLNQSANIVGSKEKPDIPVMAEVLVFTTTVSAGVTPMLSLEPLKRRTEITGAKLGLRAERFDEHQLTITFAMPERSRPVAEERNDIARQALSELDKQQLRELNNDLRGVRELVRDSQL